MIYCIEKKQYVKPGGTTSNTIDPIFVTDAKHAGTWPSEESCINWMLNLERGLHYTAIPTWIQFK